MHPLARPWHGTERYQPFFIVGSPRSGTTLVRALLEAHPDVHIPPELHGLRAVLRDWGRFSRLLPWRPLMRRLQARYESSMQWHAVDLPAEPVFRALADGPPARRSLATVLAALYRAHAARHKPAARRWGDKTPPNTDLLGAIDRVFPDVRVVHVLRDGRDVVRSHMRLADWPLPVAAHRWLYAVHAARAWGRRHEPRFLEIRYEELVRQPEAVLPRVTGFLGLEFEPVMLRHHEQALALPDLARIPILRYVQDPVTTEQVGRWQEFFSAEQVAALTQQLGPTLTALGYR